MSSYIEQLEQQNDELQQRLAKLEYENESIKKNGPRWIYDIAKRDGTIRYAYYGSAYYVIARMTHIFNSAGRIQYTYNITENPTVCKYPFFDTIEECMARATQHINNLQDQWMNNQAQCSST